MESLHSWDVHADKCTTDTMLVLLLALMLQQSVIGIGTFSMPIVILGYKKLAALFLAENQFLPFKVFWIYPTWPSLSSYQLLRKLFWLNYLVQIGRSYVISKLKDYPQFQAVAVAIQRSGFKVRVPFMDLPTHCFRRCIYLICRAVYCVFKALLSKMYLFNS